jgi:hypothetical protein
MLAVYDLKLQKEVLNQPIGEETDEPYSQMAISYNGRFVLISDPNVYEKHVAFLFDVETNQRAEFTEIREDEAFVAFTPAGILITKRFFDYRFRYQFYDPITKSKLTPPLDKSHFYLKTEPAKTTGSP